MGKARRAVSWIIGGIQCVLGSLAVVFAFLAYQSPPFRDTLAMTFREAYLYMLLLLVFSAFSILSGLLLIHREKNED
jgi:hypothetical protein